MKLTASWRPDRLNNPTNKKARSNERAFPVSSYGALPCRVLRRRHATLIRQPACKLCVEGHLVVVIKRVREVVRSWQFDIAMRNAIAFQCPDHELALILRNALINLAMDDEQRDAHI